MRHDYTAAAFLELTRAIFADHNEQGLNISPMTVGHVQALAHLRGVSSTYGGETGREIIEYVLRGLLGWHGATAYAVKAELIRRLG
jgi:hypothetical protein